MSGPVLDFDPAAARLPGAGDTREAPGFGETVAAGFGVARADTAGFVEARQVDAYRPVIDALLEAHPGRSFTAYVNPATGTVDPQAVWRDVQRMKRERGLFAELPDTIEEYERRWRKDEAGRIAGLQDTMARGNAAAGFIGAMGGAMTDPVNLYSLPLGGFGKTLGQRLLTEGLVNAGIEAAMLPTAQRNRRELGLPDLTAGEAALNIAAAGVGAAALRGGIELAPGAVRAIDAKAYELAKPVRDAIEGRLGDRELAQAFADMVPENLRTPEQEAALRILQREAELDDSSPFVRTYEALDAHRAKLEQAADALAQGRIASEGEIAAAGRTMPAVEIERIPGDRAADPGPRDDFDAVKAAIRGPESGGNDAAVNGMGSSASGRYQFIQSTFVDLYAREFGVSRAVAANAWQGRRFDPAVQERLMDRLLRENAAILERAGIRASTGNLYLAHFAGADKAVQLARAPRDAPVSDYFGPAAIAQNPGYLGGGKTVGEALDTIMAQVGGAPGEARGGASLAGLDLSDGPVLRPAALDAERPRVAVDGRAVVVSDFAADDIGVDAELMQFKSGGDQFGVTERLQGVEQWDPIAAGMVTVWEAVDGRRLIADGHQRLGLAKRIQAATGEPIRLNAFVLREADGFSAVDARILTALKNIGEGTGTATDAAKIFRDLGLDGDDVLRRLPPRSALVRDGKALARLDPEAFGAIINEVIPEHYGAAIGALVEDPRLHMAMVRILNETDPPNRLQAEAIIRQAREAGFTSETQESLFGSEQLVTGLFAQRAKLLDRALKELRKMKGAFQVAVRNADTLEEGGNRIDVDASAAAAAGNAQALALVDRLALRKGNAVNDLLDQAARRLASGEPIARVLRDFVGAVRKLDLDDLAREAGPAVRFGDGAGGSGRPGEPQGPDLLENEQLTPREADAAQAAGDAGPSLFDDDTAALFDAPDGAGVRMAAESAWHDIRLLQRPQAEPDDPGTALERWIGEDFARARAAYEAIDDTELGLTSEGGRVINTDLARELSPAYRADRSRSADVHEAASAFVKRLYAEKLREDPAPGQQRAVLFTAGGTGAGKSTGLRVLGDEGAAIIYDTNMNTLASSVKKIEQALDAGWRVKILYTYRDPIEALENGALPRAERVGRTVPITAHVDTHVGAREVMDAIAERYADDPRVVLQVIDNSRGKGLAEISTLEKLPKVTREGLHERAETAVRAAYNRGAIGRQTLRGTLGQGESDLSPAARAGSEGLERADPGSAEPRDSGPLDRGAELDPNQADRQRQLIQLGADAPMRGANRTGQAQDGTIGLGLFDTADQPRFDLDDGKGARSAAEIDAEIQAMRAGIEEIRKCLQ